ncbi:cell wall structural complex MreBCD transmembrane component MreC [Haemophilus influenzae]|uniref:Cell wall structural complex MreBCD transmembrane component MreC n=1 Tax=Haemophilus influenzae TaxID=727 RepID=A0A2X1Q1W8_HAEIF|nr:cell wall structural complex MreBCD transmembrane component MreC [Haemophilus influenzae]
MPRSVDIEKGDLLVTSGLGGRFLEGYPVAVVQSVSRDSSNYFAIVKAKPLALLERLRYVLLLWPSNLDISKVKSISPEEVRNLVQKRLESQANEANYRVKKTPLTEKDFPENEEKTIIEPDIPQIFFKMKKIFHRTARRKDRRLMQTRFILQWFTILSFFVIAFVLELAPWPVGFQMLKPAWLVLVLLYWVLAIPNK